MAGIWKKYSEGVLSSYVAACSLLDEGAARVQVLGASTVRLICYGARRHVLPPLYVTGVPRTLVDTFRTSHRDAYIVLQRSENPDAFLAVYDGDATPAQLNKVVKDIRAEWNRDMYRQQDPVAMARWESALRMLGSPKGD